MAGDMSVALEHEELVAAKLYMREDRDDPKVDADVTDHVLSARAYLAGAGVSLPAPGTERRVLYDSVCHALALGTYDKRDPLIIGTIVAENPELARRKNQLKWTEPRG